MACTTLTGIPKDCLGNIGGILSAYIIDMDDIVTFTEDTATWMVTALQLGVGDVAEDYYFKRNTSNYTEAEAANLVNGSTFVTATINLVFHRREASKSKAIKILGEGQRYLSVVVGDANGAYWYFPYAQITASGDGSGTAKADGSKYTVTLVAENQFLAKEVPAAIATALLGPAS